MNISRPPTKTVVSDQPINVEATIDLTELIEHVKFAGVLLAIAVAELGVLIITGFFK